MVFQIVDVSGSAFERGRLHGEIARSQVERSVANYAHLFAYCGISWDEAQQRAAAYREAIGCLDPDLLEEIDGIAAGSGRKAGEILALNARTEILPPSYLGKAGAPSGECTAIAVRATASATGTSMLAQNWDWLGSQREALILLRVPEGDRPGFLTLTEGGMLAKIGMNTLGFGICLNILRSVSDGRQPGVPVHVFLRALLGCRTVGDAIGLAGKLTFAASSNVLCADVRGDAASLEISPLGVRVVHGTGATLCHTNHFIAEGTEGWQLELADNLSTVPRLERARRRAAGLATLGIEDVKALLRDESEGFLSICRRPDPSLPEEGRIETVASVIMELARATIHVAPDVPSLSEYQRVSLLPEPALA